MDAWVWVLIGVLVIGVIVAWAVARARRQRLRSVFGPEYERTVEGAESRRDAEGDLRQRLKRYRKLELHPLTPEAAGAYAQQWFAIQARFVDEPEDACNRGEELLEQVLRDRGYPVDEDFDAQADLVSVDHPNLVADYRRAHEVLHTDGERGEGRNGRLEELREVFVIHRDLFSDLLDQEPGSEPELADAGDAPGPLSSSAPEARRRGPR
jgi:hypothetical protein